MLPSRRLLALLQANALGSPHVACLHLAIRISSAHLQSAFSSPIWQAYYAITRRAQRRIASKP
jgi:hypothetical protein